MSISSIHEWHRRARPSPDSKAFNVQLGCHFEEIAEMLEELNGESGESYEILVRVNAAVHELANALKRGEVSMHVRDREGFLDSLADQIVTAAGVAHCAHMNITEATHRVDESNWSKFVVGRPHFDSNGKIAKPETYRKPDLSGCY